MSTIGTNIFIEFSNILIIDNPLCQRPYGKKFTITKTKRIKKCKIHQKEERNKIGIEEMHITL